VSSLLSPASMRLPGANHAAKSALEATISVCNRNWLKQSKSALTSRLQQSGSFLDLHISPQAEKDRPRRVLQGQAQTGNCILRDEKRLKETTSILMSAVASFLLSPGASKLSVHFLSDRNSPQEAHRVFWAEVACLWLCRFCLCRGPLFDVDTG
jgi:hypothetical protein